jgi:hypothetical protein
MANEERSTRREFLRGWSAVEALASTVAGPEVELTPGGVATGNPAPQQPADALLCLQRRARVS